MAPYASLDTIIEKLRTSWMEDSLYGRHIDWNDQPTVSYHLYSTPSPWASATDARGIVPMTTKEAAHARLAFELWDDLIATDLNETFGRDPDISFAHSTTSDGTYTSSDSSGSDLTDADIWIQTDPSATAGARDAEIFFGSDAFGNSYLHEIGHSLGLSHPGRYNSRDGAPDVAEYAQDNGKYTVMSYFGADVDHHGSFASTPLLHDIAAIQAIYHPDTGTRTDATTYGFHSNAGKMIDGMLLNPYDFDQNPSPVFAIWDAGGIDTLDASGYSTSQRINLAPGAFSSIGGLTDNIAMSFEVRVDGQVINLIENAVGGSGNDEIRGNDANNRLEGGGGPDTLIAGIGVDTLVGGPGHDILMGAGGDILEGGLDNDDYYVTAGDTVTELSGGGIDTVHTTLPDYTLRAWVDNLTFNNDFDLTAAHTGYGNGLRNEFTGAGGVDTFYGYGGNDVFKGGDGIDRFYGGRDNDTYYVEAGDNVIEYDGEGTADKVYTELSRYDLPDYVENLEFTNPVSSPSARHVGNGNSQGNQINGAGGGDSLYGGAGTDTLRGGGGDDHLFGGSSSDTLYGGPNNDLLVGGDSGDTLYGGSGSDTFMFTSLNDSFQTIYYPFGSTIGIVLDNTDTIADFAHGVDKIDLEKIDADSASLLTDEAFKWEANPARHGDDWTATVWTRQIPGSVAAGTHDVTMLYASTDSDAAAEFQIRLTGLVTLTASDFYHL